MMYITGSNIQQHTIIIPELLENPEEMFPRHYLHINVPIYLYIQPHHDMQSGTRGLGNVPSNAIIHNISI